MTPRECVQGIYQAFEALDLEAVYELLDDNVTYQNMAQAPLHGKKALQEMWTGFDRIDKLDLKILNTAVNDDVVMVERLDHLVLGGQDIFIPMVACFNVRDGLVVSWREYYDMATMEAQMGTAHPGSTLPDFTTYHQDKSL